MGCTLVTSRNSYPKVLIALPIFEEKDYIFKENFEAIKAIDYPNFDYIYIDNSKNLNYVNKLRRRGARAVHVPRGGNSRQAICNSQNLARNMMIEGEYDYLMFVESDLLPTPECISVLMSHGKGVTGALYYIGHKVKIPCVFFLDWKNPVNLGSRLIHPTEVPAFLNSGLREVHGLGLGCTLVRSDIIKRFPFWYDERFDNKHSDVYFYLKLHNAGYKVYVDTNYIIKHFPSEWSSVTDK